MALASLAMALAGCGPGRPLSETGPVPPAVEPPASAEIDAAMRRGIAFLIAHQNADGSWGSARNTKGLNVYAPVPGAHTAFRAGVSALAVMALCETLDRTAPDQSAAARSALARGEEYLLANLPGVRRCAPDALYNVWSHAYGIRALVRMARRSDDPHRRERIRKLIASQVDMLARFESVSGGWGYYDFGYSMQKPGMKAMPFTTATSLIALDEARRFGVDVPQRLIDRGLGHLRRTRNPDGSFCYSEMHVYRPGRTINRPSGSLGRSQACNLAMRTWGDAAITDAVLEAWLNRLWAREGWLSRARKMPVPHESFCSISGYFYYYGIFYAGGCIEQLPPERRPWHQAHLARILLDLQETDGSWWDYPLYDYHKGWGTAMAMMALKDCQVSIDN
ncbi:MAG: hypothetical protein BWX88_02892 [Planctomycetes bacterium ADurb.Bin126]|nr:MAG: hypothetical protein BWX88_02892 [Planctomycetes bacterium ADurb.Bin126]HOD84389.1 hypothetical protein [Phycisphaerae bacterium]HQL76307.1 hypothetical protein [Phycisphaerae bacterium]